MLAYEYLPNGSLAELRERTARDNYLIPNRVLWSIFLCLIRQVNALSNPPNAGSTLATYREHAEDETTANWTHNSSDLENYVFGRLDPNVDDDDEHTLVPVVKLSNFTRATEENTDMDAYFYNIRQIGKVMLEMTCNTTPLDQCTALRRPVMYNPTNDQFNDVAFNDVEPNYDPISTDCPGFFLDMPGVDPALKELVARCMGSDTDDMWARNEFQTLIQDGLLRRTWEDIPDLMGDPEDLPATRRYEVGDYDDVITEFVQDYILNADTTRRSMLGATNIQRHLDRVASSDYYDPWNELELQRHLGYYKDMFGVLISSWCWTS
ncbi:hypothetical protein F4677DRAFT_401952 [Hypoxylon crocopeplum]|nr:hypothetical protein F4677DRAFT_401952 [Hypoxylon crocopeplum]